MINARVGNTGVNSGIKSPAINARVSSFNSGSNPSATHDVGTPIGLLLVLTYSTTFTDTSTFFSDDRPNARIESN